MYRNNTDNSQRYAWLYPGALFLLLCTTVLCVILCVVSLQRGKEIKQLTQSLSAYAETNAKLEAQTGKLKAELDDATAQLEQTQAQLAQANAMATLYFNAAGGETLTRALEENVNLRAENEELNQRLNARAREAESRLVQIRRQASTISALTDENAVLTDENAVLTDKNVALNEEINSKNQQISRQAENIGVLQTERNTLTRQVASIREQCNAKEARISALTTRIDAITDENKALVTENSVLTAENESLQGNALYQENQRLTHLISNIHTLYGDSSYYQVSDDGLLHVYAKDWWGFWKWHEVTNVNFAW